MSHPPIELDGAVVLVTGAARGIGRETAAAFVREGARVAVCDLDTELAAETAAALGEAAMPFALDVASRESFAGCVKAVRAALGPIDVLVNNAGIAPSGPFFDEADAVTDAVFDVNVRGVITGMRLVVPEMRERGHGHIVNIASLIGKTHIPGFATYATSKHAVVGLGLSARAELRGTGITLTTVLPSIVNTELASGIPLSGLIRRTIRVEPQDIANAVVGSVAHRPAEIAVPRWLGALAEVTSLVPEPIETLVRRLVGDDRALTRMDPVGRAAYAERLARQTKQADEPVEA